MSRHTRILALGSTTLMALGAAVTLAAPAMAGETPDGHALVCQSASVYEHYSPDIGRFGTNWIMYGPNSGHTPERFGHTEGVHADRDSYAYGLDFGRDPGWGWILHSCLSPNVT